MMLSKHRNIVAFKSFSKVFNSCLEFLTVMVLTFVLSQCFIVKLLTTPILIIIIIIITNRCEGEVGSYPENSIVGDSKDTKESTIPVRRRKRETWDPW